MRRIAPLILAGVLLLPSAAAAQSSQFGVRGLGLPVRPLSPRAVATGGAFGSFDSESSVNPATIAGLVRFTTMFTSAQNFRTSTNPFGSASGRDNRFPHVQVAGPVSSRLSASVSMSGYTDRNFALGTADTIDLRGARVGVFDTLTSRGGLSDLRVAAGWQPNRWLLVGAGLHAITGSNRIDNRRVFADSSYATALERSEVSYFGLGASIGAVVRPVPHLTVAGTFRSDGHLAVERDTVRIARTDLPTSWVLGVRWEPSLSTSWAASFQQKNWSASDADIRDQGGIGANNAYQIATGVEFLRDPRNPGHHPLRLGVSYGTLPFPVRVGKQANEFGLSAGTGVRFIGGRGGVDLSLQQLWRSDGDGFSERATIVTVGFTLRP